MSKIGGAPSPDQFQQAAQQAQAKGGVVRLNKRGQPVVKGTNWRGRAVMWTQEKLAPTLARRRNEKVLASFQKSLDSAYDVSSQRTLGEMTSARLPAKMVADNIDETASAYKDATAQALGANRQAAAFFENIESTAGAFDELAGLAGKEAKSLNMERDYIGLRFGQFVKQLAKNPLLASGVIPHAGRDTATIAKWSHNYRAEDGNFKPEFMKAALIVTMENVDEAESADPTSADSHAFGVKGAHAEAELDWLRDEYAHCFPAAPLEQSEMPAAPQKSQPQEVPTANLIDI